MIGSWPFLPLHGGCQPEPGTRVGPSGFSRQPSQRGRPRGQPSRLTQEMEGQEGNLQPEVSQHVAAGHVTHLSRRLKPAFLIYVQPVLRWLRTDHLHREMMLTRQPRSGAGSSEAERLCWPGARTPSSCAELSQAGRCVQPKSLLSPGLRSLLGEMGLLIAVPLTSQSGGEGWRRPWISKCFVARKCEANVGDYSHEY